MAIGDSMINVLTVIRHPVGGIRTYLKYTYGSLDKDRYHFTIVTVKDPEGSLLKEDLKGYHLDLIEVDGRFIIPLLIFAVRKALRAGRFDVIHSQGFSAGIITVLGSLFAGVPHLMTSHDVFRADQFETKFDNLVKRRLLGLLFSRIDMIQSVSHDAQANLLDYLPPLSKHTDKLRVILNGIPVDRFSAVIDEGQPLKEEVGMAESAFLFGFLGRFMPQKGFVYLVDAVEHLSRNENTAGRFKILAVNEGALIREYKALVQEKGLSEYFVFYGFAPNVARILTQLDAIVIPSLWEACPLQPLEAFFVGCPVIASNCIGLREVTEETPALVFDQANSRSIVEALEHFMHHSSDVKRRTVEFIGAAKKRFGVEETARELAALFDELVTKNGGPAALRKSHEQ